VASLDRVDVGLLKQAVQAGADALEVHVATDAEIEDLAEATRSLSIPVGVAAAFGAAQRVTGHAEEKGFDWVRLPIDAPFSVLAKEKPARLLTLPVTLDLRVASAVSGLPVEAVVVEASDNTAVEMTLGDALRLRALRDVTQKLVFLDVGLGVPPDAVAAVGALGINGLLVRIPGPDAGLIREYIADLEAAAGTTLD
jgi:hypothetical protein